MSEQAFQPMTSHRPYLLRALYEWVVDNGMTPHVLVDALQPGVRVPQHVVSDGKVVLNIAERAVARLQMDNEAISFSARFNGASHQVEVPVSAVVAIYARETGQGMVLPEDIAGPPSSPDDSPDTDPPPPTDDGPDPDAPPPKRSHLRVVK